MERAVGLGNHEILPGTERITSVPVLRINARLSPPSAATTPPPPAFTLSFSRWSIFARFPFSVPLCPLCGLMNRTQRNYVGASTRIFSPVLVLVLLLPPARLPRCFVPFDRLRKFNDVSPYLRAGTRRRESRVAHGSVVHVDYAGRCEKSNASEKRTFYARARRSSVARPSLLVPFFFGGGFVYHAGRGTGTIRISIEEGFFKRAHFRVEQIFNNRTNLW